MFEILPTQPSSDVKKGRVTERHVATTADGRTHSVDITGMHDELIGAGGYGSIRRVDADVVKPRKFPFRFRESSKSAGNMVVKEYNGIRGSEQHLQHVLETHRTLRGLGISTWNTFRRLQGERSILMTDGERDGSVLFSQNVSTSASVFDYRKLVSLERFPDAVGDGINSVEAANRNGVCLPGDSWFAGVDVRTDAGSDGREALVGDTGTLKRILVGDLDNILVGSPSANVSSKNCLDFESFVGQVVVSKCLREEVHSAYHKELGRMMEARFPGYRSRYATSKVSA